MQRPRRAIRQGLFFGMLEGAVVAALFVCMEAWMVPLLQVRLGAGAWVIGLMAVIPQLGIVCLAPFAGNLITRLGGNKRAALVVCWIQIACVLGLFAPLAGAGLPWAVPLATTLICVFGLTGVIAGPAWVAWMGDLIPPGVRGSYQAHRARLFQVCKLACAGGFAGLMHLLPAHDTGWGLATILGLAVISRLASIWCLARQPELPGRPIHASIPMSNRSARAAVGLPGFLRTLHQTDLGRWTLVWALFHLGVAVGGPFFASYMVAAKVDGGLALDATWYSILIYTSAVSRIAVYPLVGRLIDLFGAAAMLRVSLLIIMCIPVAWALTDRVWVLVIDEVIAGAAWAIAECAVGSLLFGCHRDPQRRAELIGYHVTVTCAMIALGSIIGTTLIDLVPPIGGSRYHTLFLLSVALRIPGVVLAARWLPPLRELSHAERDDLWERIPGAGLTNSLGRGLAGIFRRPEG